MESTTRTRLHELDLAVRQALSEMTTDELIRLDCHASIRGVSREELVSQIVSQTAGKRP